MKIFIGTSEIAGMLTFVADAYRVLGHDVTTCVNNFGKTFYNQSYDIILNKQILPEGVSQPMIDRVCRKVNRMYQSRLREQAFKLHRDLHDVYIFIWNGFNTDSTADYEYLKKKGKKIVSIFCGSEVRHISAFTQEYGLDVSIWERWFHEMDINDPLFRIRKAELYSDAIFSVPDQAGLSIRPYHKIYIPFLTSSIEPIYPAREVPKLVHIPSMRGIKGTTYVVEAVNRLKQEGLAFEFEFISGVANQVVLEKLRDADILVDELFLHGPGTLSLEGMASGCAVATKTIKGEVYDGVVCNVNPENVYSQIKRLISDYDYRQRIAIEGRRLIEILNEPTRIAADILNKALRGPNTKSDFDYYPRFFSDQYELPENAVVSARNKGLSRQVIEKFGLDATLNIQRMRDQKLI